MNIADARLVRIFDKDTNEQSNHVTLHEECIPPARVIASLVGCIERVSDLIDPILGTLLTLVVDSDVDGIEIYNFLESNRDNIRCQFSFGTPISTEPRFQRLILTLGIDIECTAK